MGKITSETPNETTIINHFSHPHPLKLHNFQVQTQQTLITPSSCCSGCMLQVTGLTYSCTTCNYFLHKKCSEMPQKISHPFHKQHVFSLLPKPVYPNGVFHCDACGEAGNGFSYHCKECTLDMHILCSVLPTSLTHASHPHQLNLAFECPYPSKSFCCDICRKNTLSNHWLYRCNPCGFDAHLNCAKTVIMSSSTPHQVPHMQKNPTTNFSFQSQTPIPQPFTSFLRPQTPAIPQSFTPFQPQTPAIPQSFTSFQPQTPIIPQSFTSFRPQTPVPNVSFGIPAPASTVTPTYGDRQFTEAYLHTLQQITNAQQNYLQTLFGAGGGGADRETQQLLQMLSNLNLNGGSGSIPGFDPTSGGVGSVGIPGLDAFGGGAGGQDFLQALMNGGGGLAGGGVGGLDLLQSLLSGGGNGVADLLGGGGDVLSSLGGLNGLF